jgi:hypothetical protein
MMLDKTCLPEDLQAALETSKEARRKVTELSKNPHLQLNAVRVEDMENELDESVWRIEQRLQFSPASSASRSEDVEVEEAARVEAGPRGSLRPVVPMPTGGHARVVASIPVGDPMMQQPQSEAGQPATMAHF